MIKYGGSGMAKEQLKSVTLVSLFGLCVLLVSQIWSDISLDLFNYSNKGNTVAFEKIQIDQVISPQGYVFNFGGKSHTVNYSDKYQVWQEAKPALIDLLKNHEEIQNISVEKWDELNSFRSIRLELPYTISSDLLLNFLTEESVDASVTMEFSQILLPMNDQKTIYFGNPRQNAYYAVIGKTAYKNMTSLLAYVESSEENLYHTVNEHYNLKAILGVEGFPFEVNRNLIPRFQVEEIPVVKVIPEIDITDDSEETQALIQTYANQAFDGRFDFVNRLQDVDGSVVFIYGYGEKALKLGAYGELEYKEKLDEAKAGPKLGFKDSLKVAMDFINRYGGIPSGTYLKSYQENTGVGSRGYHFTFGYRVQGYSVVNSQNGTSNAIEVEVFGTQVLSFKRLVRKYVKIADVPEIMEQQMILNDVFIMNSDRIFEDYQEVDQLLFDNNQVYQILQKIGDVSIVYFSDLENNSERLMPAWYVEIDKNSYYFNMHTGAIMKSMRTK